MTAFLSRPLVSVFHIQARAMGLFLSAPPVPSPPPSSSAAAAVPFRPSIAVIVGVLTTLFSLTFLLLLYARHCKRGATGYPSGAGGFPSSAAAEQRNSGVGRAVVESLPAFRFCALRGQKDGLECAVCLSRFEPAEVLRLLPKCRHAFHVECVDVWLDAHSTCPLCRVRVHPEDILLIPEPKPDPEPEPEPDLPRLPRRFSGRHSSAGEKSSGNSLQIVIHRVDSAGSADRPGKGKIRKDGLLMTESKEEREQFERRYSHRIVLEDGEATRDRWSDLRPSDLLFLRSEMLMTDSGRFSASRVSRASGLEPAGAVQRAASEITGVSRFAPRAIEEERKRKKWLGLAAQRSARWLGSRESRNDGSG